MVRLTEELAFKSGTELGNLLASGQVGALELLEAYIARIESFDGSFRSHVLVDHDGARRAARNAERELAAGKRRGPLHGVPVSHKDNLWTSGLRTGVHTRTSISRDATEDATAVARLRGAGLIVLGKTNTTEFACGDQQLHGDTPNPWDRDMHSGASSAGSASALAAGLTGVATGSDTGGSIRAPSALCGIVGVKPTYGRVSRHGLVPLAWSLDNVGPMARSVQDVAHMLAAMSGYDRLDPTSSRRPVPQDLARLDGPLVGLVIGVATGHFATDVEPAVSDAVGAALRVLEGQGAILEEVYLPSAAELVPIGNLLTTWEGFTLHAETLRTEAEMYGTRARPRLASGGFYSAADVGKAMQLRALWAQEVADAFHRVDAIVTPTLPYTAVGREDWVVRPADTSWATRAFNLTGNPAMNVPCGFDSKSRPIGMQVVARHFDEHTMLRIAHCFEQATDWHKLHPDESSWTEPVLTTTATAFVPSQGDEGREPWRSTALSLGLNLNDSDLDTVRGLVLSVKDGLDRAAVSPSLDIEPTAWLAASRRAAN